MRGMVWLGALLGVGLALSGCSASEGIQSTPPASLDSSPDPTICQAEDFDDHEDLVCRFGQTAVYPFSTRVDLVREYLPLEITVSAPKQFKPADPKDNTQRVAVYFNVQVKNASDELTADFNSLLATAISGGNLENPGSAAGEGVDGDPIYDFDQGVSSVDGLQHLKPGKTYKFKEGFSVASATGLILKLRPNGAGGPTYHFIP